MPSSLRSLFPYAHLWDHANGHPEMDKVQSYISRADRRTVLAAVGGDDAVYNLLIQHAFHRTAHFIRSHGLNAYSDENTQRVIDFIRNGAAAHVADSPSTPTNPGPSTGGQPTPPSIPSQPAPGDQSNPGRVGRIKDAVKRVKEKRRVEAGGQSSGE